MILPHVLTQLFPWWFAGVLLAGVVAAMISTAESMLLVAASSVSQDVYNGIIRGGRAHESSLLLLSRFATLAIGGLAFWLSIATSDLIYYIVSYAWAGIGCSFAPAVLLSFYWKRFGSLGVVTSLLVGLLVTVVWIGTGLDQTITARAVTFLAAMGAAVSVTLLSPEPQQG
jgi:sodium/proline symporter